MPEARRSLRRTLPAPTVSAATELYLLALDAAGRSPKTLTLYRTALRALRLGTDDAAVDTITADAARRLLVHLRDQGRAASTRSVYAVVWGAFAGFLVDEGLLKTSFMARVQRPGIPATEPPGFTADELRALLATCETRTLGGLRDRAIILTLAATALRLSEFLQLRRADLAVEGPPMLRVVGKGQKERRVVLQRTAHEAIRRYLLARGDDAEPALWRGERGALGERGLYQMVRRRGAQAGIAGVHPHRFRNAALSLMADAGLAEADVQRIAGHRNAAQTRHYVAWSALERANAALLEAAPLDKLDLDARPRRKRGR